MTKYLVEAVSMFRNRYVIEAKSVEHAKDEFVMNNGSLREFSQQHLDEIITSTREIDNTEYLRLFDEDNDYLKDWPDNEKLQQVNVIIYKES